MAIEELDGPKMVHPTHLSREQLDTIRTELVRQREEFDEPIEDPTKDADPADDPGTRLSEFQEFETLAARQSAGLEAIDHAIRRLDDGVYGTCEACGVEIPFERLEAIPDAVLCIDCQAKVTG